MKADVETELSKLSFDYSSINCATESLINCVKRAVDMNTKLIKISHKLIKEKDWITPPLLKSISIKQKLFLKTKKYPHDQEATQNYKNYRNVLNNLIKINKREYFQKQITADDRAMESRNLWRTVKNLTGRTTKKENITEDRNSAGNIVKLPRNIAEVFNEHYSKIGKTLAEKINLPANFSNPKKYTCKASVYLAPITEQEIADTIKTMKTKTAPGPDRITVEILKSLTAIITPYLTDLFNEMIRQGTLPDLLKSAIITPVFKSGDKTLQINYRPISVISNVAKLLEKIIKNRLINYLEKHNILSQHQYGFRTNRSTQDAIMEVTSNK